MIKTSYYAKYRGNAACCISVTHPPGFKGVTCEQLYPPKSLLAWYKHNLNEITKKYDNAENIDTFIELRKSLQRQYDQSYREDVLYRLDPHNVAAMLDGKVLLCWEKSGQFCHRYIVAEWLREHGYKCEELIYKNELKSGKTK